MHARTAKVAWDVRSRGSWVVLAAAILLAGPRDAVGSPPEPFVHQPGVLALDPVVVGPEPVAGALSVVPVDVGPSALPAAVWLQAVQDPGRIIVAANPPNPEGMRLIAGLRARQPIENLQLPSGQTNLARTFRMQRDPGRPLKPVVLQRMPTGSLVLSVVVL